MNTCRNNIVKMGVRNFISCKIDNTAFGEDSLIAVPYAEYNVAVSPTCLKIITKTATQQLTIFIYGQKVGTNIYPFGEEAPDFYYNFAVITTYRKGMQIDYDKDSWFAFGKADLKGHSRGSITISRYNAINHQIEGTFKGKFYNAHKKTTKKVSEGKFSLPLITLK